MQKWLLEWLYKTPNRSRNVTLIGTFVCLAIAVVLMLISPSY